MQDYRCFEPEALAADPSFQRWQLLDEPTDVMFWTDWMSQNPDKQELVGKATYLLRTISSVYQQRLEADAQLSDQEVQTEIRQLHQLIQESDDSWVMWYQLTPVRYGMAASFLILLSLFGWYTFQPDSAKQAVTYRDLVNAAAGTLSEVVNTTNKPLQTNLPDGSTVLLYPRSRVSFENRFTGNKREVYLSGKGYFNVTKNPSKPFYVYANQLVTRVLGTSFTVQAYEGDRQTKVVVRTGKVSVFALNDGAPGRSKRTDQPAAIVLTPNQQLVFSATQTRLIKSLVAQPVPLPQATQPPVLTFKRTPIADVFAALGQTYGITIVFDPALMRNCYLTASLSDEPLFEKLDLICRTVNASYAQSDGAILINSKGCDD